jgi:hypothetical protein
MSMTPIQVMGERMLFAKPFRVIIDSYTTSGKVYFGFAPSGSLKSEAKWTILCLAQTNSGQINDFEWCMGAGMQDNKIWDKRADGTYTYHAD